MDQELRDFLPALETRLLSEFWKWARTTDIKVRHNSNGISTLDERLTAVEERPRDIELRRAA